MLTQHSIERLVYQQLKELPDVRFDPLEVHRTRCGVCITGTAHLSGRRSLSDILKEFSREFEVGVIEHRLIECRERGLNPATTAPTSSPTVAT